MVTLNNPEKQIAAEFKIILPYLFLEKVANELWASGKEENFHIHRFGKKGNKRFEAELIDKWAVGWWKEEIRVSGLLDLKIFVSGQLKGNAEVRLSLNFSGLLNNNSPGLSKVDFKVLKVQMNTILGFSIPLSGLSSVAVSFFGNNIEKRLIRQMDKIWTELVVDKIPQVLQNQIEEKFSAVMPKGYRLDSCKVSSSKPTPDGWPVVVDLSVLRGVESARVDFEIMDAVPFEKAGFHFAMTADALEKCLPANNLEIGNSKVEFKISEAVVGEGKMQLGFLLSGDLSGSVEIEIPTTPSGELNPGGAVVNDLSLKLNNWLSFKVGLFKSRVKKAAVIKLKDQWGELTQGERRLYSKILLRGERSVWTLVFHSPLDAAISEGCLKVYGGLDLREFAGLPEGRRENGLNNNDAQKM